MGALENLKKFAQDGWKNLVTGLNTSADKKKYTSHKLEKIIRDDELESIFIEDGLGARIVTELPNDMFREGWDYAFPDLEEGDDKDDTLDVYKDIFEQVGAVAKLKEAFYWSRLYGGAVILIGALDGQSLDKPLNPKRIRYFDNLRIIDRTAISFDRIRFQLDPKKRRYGQPEFYPIQFEIHSGVYETQEVHFTRIIELHGVKVPTGATRTLTKEQRYWGVSVIQNAYDHLKTVGGSLGSAASLLEEFSVGKFKLANFADIMSQTDGIELMKRRVELNDLVRSVYHSMYMDKEDEFVRENVSFAGIPDVLYIFMMMVSACSGYPITRLFGVSPAGLNSTGESDMRNYYDRVRSEQVTVLEPILIRLVKIISEWQGKDEPYIEWRPLVMLTDKEKSELEKLDAEKKQIEANMWKTYIDAGIVEPYEAAFLQFGDELEKIPVPKEFELPPVETVPVPEESNENGEDANAEEDNSNGEGNSANKNAEPANKEGEKNNETPPEDDKEGEEPDIEERIAELEGKDKLTDEEQKELDELKKKAEKPKPKKKNGGTE